MMMVGVASAIIGCGTIEPKESKTVYVQEDAKLLAAVDQSTAEATKQTDLLTQIVEGQNRLIETLNQPSGRRRAGSDALPVSIVDGDDLKQSLKDLEVLDTSEPAGPATKSASDQDENGWPEGIRLQVWRDGLPDSVRWEKEELPLLGVTAENFESVGSLANQYKIAGFTIVLVGTDGKEAGRYVNPVPASQIIKAAREIKSGKSLVASSGANRKCLCPNCNCEIDCDCDGSSYSTSTSIPSYATNFVQFSEPVRWSSAVQSYSQPQQPTVRSMPRTRCVNRRCYQY
jgi:hypothetical protein